jgi:hypothetical protein
MRAPRNSCCMKKTVSVLLLVAALCSGCATQYSLVLTNGEVITSRGKPRFDAEKGGYIYKDSSGQSNFVFAGKVREVEPSSMAAKSGPNFLK